MGHINKKSYNSIIIF